MYYSFDAAAVSRIKEVLVAHAKSLLRSENAIRIVDGKTLEIKFGKDWKEFDIDLAKVSTWIAGGGAKWDPPWTKGLDKRLTDFVKSNKPNEYTRINGDYMSLYSLESILKKLVNPSYTNNVQVSVRRDVTSATIRITFYTGQTETDWKGHTEIIQERDFSYGETAEIAGLFKAACDRALFALGLSSGAPQTVQTPREALPIIAEMNRPKVEVKAPPASSPANSTSQLPDRAANRFELLEPVTTPAKATTTFVVAKQTQKQPPTQKEAQPAREFSRAELLDLDNNTKVCQAEPVVNERGALLEMD